MSTAFGGHGGAGGSAGLSGDALATFFATGVEVHLRSVAQTFERAGASGAADAQAIAQASLGEISASAAIADGALALATGTVAMTLVGPGAAVAARARAGVVADPEFGWDSTSVLETALTDADLDAIYAGRSRIAQAFSVEPLETTAVQAFSAVRGESRGEQTITSSLRLQVSTLDLDAAGDLTFGLYGDDAFGDGFDTMQFNISVGSVDAVTLVKADFSTKASGGVFPRPRLLLRRPRSVCGVR